MTLAIDLLHPSPAAEAQTHKLKRVVQSPSSFYMDVKCSGCHSITPLFSHADTVVSCPKCSAVLSQPTGGLARLSEGVSFRKKTY
ncbi:40S ribosomal protein S27 [Podila clonocystis]|nr:40S ribosomal protein S27 [Podila clonocystis]